MINTTTLITTIREYRQQCQDFHHKPTYKGIAALLGISGRTIANVVQGSYNGRKYGEKPHATRCIDNSDFEVVQGLFR